MPDVTHLLAAIERGDPHAANQHLPVVYDELLVSSLTWLLISPWPMFYLF